MKSKKQIQTKSFGLVRVRKSCRFSSRTKPSQNRCVQAEKTMKIKLISVILIFTSILSFGQSVSKSELKKMLKETLVKSRNYVSDATNSWYYDNTENDYETQDILTFNTARSFKRDYCKIINWTFYEWNKFRLEFADYCNVQKTAIVSHLQRIKVSIVRRMKLSHPQRMKLSH